MRFALAALFCLSFPACAETRQHGNVIFDIPEGWQTGAVEDGNLILWSDLPDEECRFCRIYISPGEGTGEPADAWVANRTTRFIDPGDDPPEITRLSGPSSLNLSGRPAAALAQKLDSRIQVLFAVQLPGRMELFGFEGDAGDPDQVAQTMRVFERDVVPMIETARFVSDGAAPLMSAPEPGDLHGVWWGTSTRWALGIDGNMQMKIDHHWLTFWPDGIFYNGTPPAGTAPFDPDERLAAGDMNWGSYRREGDRLILSYTSGRVETLTADGARFTVGDRVMDPITPLADGTRIDGVVSTLSVSGFTPGIGMSGGMTAMTDTTYRPDGSWTFASYTGASSSFENGVGFATGAEGSEQGRYQVRNGLVVLHDQSGAVVARHYIFNAGSAVWIGKNRLE